MTSSAADQRWFYSVLKLLWSCVSTRTLLCLCIVTEATSFISFFLRSAQFHTWGSVLILFKLKWKCVCKWTVCFPYRGVCVCDCVKPVPLPPPRLQTPFLAVLSSSVYERTLMNMHVSAGHGLRRSAGRVGIMLSWSVPYGSVVYMSPISCADFLFFFFLCFVYLSYYVCLPFMKMMQT